MLWGVCVKSGFGQIADLKGAWQKRVGCFWGGLIPSITKSSITKQLSRSIEKCLSKLSSKDIFYETTSFYEHRLASCGYNEKLTYKQQGENNKNTGKNRKRNIIWLNPRYCKSLKTNIGKYFFRLLNKHFPTGHKLHNIFNRNTLKLSYSCMPNREAKIDGHNKKMLENIPPPKTKLCNCLKENCPMRGVCLTENVFYYAKISCDNEKYKLKLYKRICRITLQKS